MVYGTTFKELIQEEFGDGIMSAIDFNMTMEREANNKGDRVQARHVGQVPAVQILRQRRDHPGIRIQGGVRLPVWRIRGASLPPQRGEGDAIGATRKIHACACSAM